MSLFHLTSVQEPSVIICDKQPQLPLLTTPPPRFPHLCHLKGFTRQQRMSLPSPLGQDRCCNHLLQHQHLQLPQDLTATQSHNGCHSALPRFLSYYHGFPLSMTLSQFSLHHRMGLLLATVARARHGCPHILLHATPLYLHLLPDRIIHVAYLTLLYCYLTVEPCLFHHKQYSYLHTFVFILL